MRNIDKILKVTVHGHGSFWIAELCFAIPGATNVCESVRESPFFEIWPFKGSDPRSTANKKRNLTVFFLFVFNFEGRRPK